MTDDAKPMALHEIRYTLGRREWAKTEWPALLFWVAPAGLALVGVLAKVAQGSGWWALGLPVWWIFLGARASGLILFLVFRSRVLIQITRDGVVFAGEGGSNPVYAHWSGILNQGDTFLLWGGDGRHRLIIPRRALTQTDLWEVQERMGIDLAALSVGQETSLWRS